MATQTKLVTYDDYRSLPDDGKRYEIIGGKLFMAPAPEVEHQRISRKLMTIIDRHVEQHNLGEVFSAPIDVVLSKKDVVQPDLIFISEERQDIITQKNIADAPDLVIEILSDSTKSVDRNQKMKLYEQYAVKEYWLIHPQQKQIEQFVLSDEHFLNKDQGGPSEKITSEIIAGLSMSAEEIF